MSVIRKPIDGENGLVQFEIAENAQSIGFIIGGIPDSVDCKVRVELISKNKTNQTLYDLKMEDLRKILSFAYPKMGNVLPFAIGKSLVLNDDNKLLVTILFPAETIATSFAYTVNTYVEITQNPMVIKTVKVEEEAEVSTEFYPLMLVSQDAESYETLVMVKDQVGVLIPNKVFFGKDFIEANIQNNSEFLPMVTQSNQKVKIVGNSTNYLLLI
ncbi:hypothetical protein J4771_02355 [Candidatus Kaistella beijingensis]|uniref:hypothetical protein n=1 Tax=Candidatus Kaistella beijingensis TaxID=2820270 RepID=UPI001CC67EAA|nr:hypothetical protein [Candidatus Kaistella beijingensis]UBB90218.1 hypothetical protein J4771_02355 [Candidatus Kaistella beijingensis]